MVGATNEVMGKAVGIAWGCAPGHKLTLKDGLTVHLESARDCDMKEGPAHSPSYSKRSHFISMLEINFLL